jgi:uncharacterized membrane protein YgcG
MNLPIRLSQLLLVASVFLCITCNKHFPDSASQQADLVTAARSYIDSISAHGYPVNYRAAQPKTIRWDLARLVQVGRTQAISVPLVFRNAILMKANFVGDQYFHVDYLTQLLFYKDSTGKNTAFVITAFPDSNYFKDPTRPFTGIKFIEDWLGHPLQKLLYTPDGHINQYVPTNKQPAVAEVMETCYEITGYNYSPDDPDDIYYWSEPGGCSIDYIDDGSGGGGGGGGAGGGGGPSGGGASSAKPSFTILPGTSVIKNIQQYFQCFTNVGGSDHTYTVTVCVDQADPGTRTPWSLGEDGSSGSSAGDNPVDVGHVFLELTETYNNTTITRNVGFYPAGNVNPSSTSSQGTLNDDETQVYNISGSFTVNNAQFFNILNFVSQGSNPGYLYNLNTNNCTTFVISAVAQGGITLPRTIGTWLGGAGNDPGDLGEDLRENNIPGMSLNLTGGSDNSHYNVGQCN